LCRLHRRNRFDGIFVLRTNAKITPLQAPVADARQLSDAALDQRRGRLHVHHLGRARIADRPSAAHEEDGALVDHKRWIIDALGTLLLDRLAACLLLMASDGLGDRMNS
jgi:hypothetical protein